MKPNAFVCLLIGLALAAPLPAQERQRVSPHETVNAAIGGGEISLTYGRPYTKDPKSGEKRTIWGGLVPYGKVWRMGADEATVLKTSKDLEIVGKTIPAGSYSLFLLPEKENAKLVVNKQTGQWGTRYDEAQDLARIDLIKEAAAKPVDQFSMAIDKAGDKGGVLKIMWEDVQYSAPFTVK